MFGFIKGRKGSVGTSDIFGKDQLLQPDFVCVSETQLLDNMVNSVIDIKKRCSEVCSTNQEISKKLSAISKMVLDSDKKNFHKFFQNVETHKEHPEELHAILLLLHDFLDGFIYEKYASFRTDPIWTELQKKSPTTNLKKSEKNPNKKEIKLGDTKLSPENYEAFKMYSEKNSFVWEFKLLMEIQAYKTLYQYIVSNDKSLNISANDIANSYKNLRFSHLPSLVSNPMMLLSDSNTIFELLDEITERFPEKKENIESLMPKKKELEIKEQKTVAEADLLETERAELIQEQLDNKMDTLRTQSTGKLVTDTSKLSKEELLVHYCKEGASEEFIALTKEMEVWKPVKDQHGSSLLHISVVNGSKITEFLIENGMPLDAEDPSGRTPLFFACSVGNKEAVLFLLGNKASANWKDLSGASPLSICLRRHFFDIANDLVLFGADVNYKKPNGSTYTHESIILQDKEIFDWLLDHDVKLNIKDYLGETPLLKSLSCKETHYFSRLMTIKSIDISILTKLQKNIIQHIVSNQSIEYLKLYLKTPIENLIRYENLFKGVDSNGNSILHLALLTKNFSLVKVLVLLLKRLSIPLDELLNSKGETVCESAAQLSQQMVSIFLDPNGTMSQVGIIKEIVKISKYLEEVSMKKDGLISQETDTKVAQMFENIIVSTGQSIAELSKHHRIVIFTIKWTGCPVCAELIDRVAMMLPYFMKWNTIPIIGHQQKESTVKKFFDEANGVTKHLPFCKIGQVERKIFGLTNASLSEHFKMMPSNFNAMAYDGRSLSLPTDVYAPLTAFGIFTIENSFFVKKLIYKDFTKKLNFGIFLQGMKEFVSDLPKEERHQITDYFSKFKEFKSEMAQNTKLTGRNSRKSRGSSGKIKNVDINGELDKEEQKLMNEMNEVLDDEVKRYYFKAFATNDLNLDPVAFCQEVKEFKMFFRDSQRRREKFERIYVNYLSENGISEIQVSKVMVGPIKKLFVDGVYEKVKSDVFDEIYNEVSVNVLLDVFEDFKCSNLYQEMLSKKTTVTYFI